MNKERVTSIILVATVFLGVILTRLYSFLLFHSAAEIFSIVVAGGIFMVAWTSRRQMDNNYLLLIGIAYLFVGCFDLVHTLAYKGMGVFQGYTANLPTQLWIIARYTESVSLLVGTFFINRQFRVPVVMAFYIIYTGLLFASIFYLPLFPDCFIEGVGLTPFKKYSEHLISLILLAVIAQLYKHREEFEPYIFRLLIASVAVTIVSELLFTFYISVYGLSNLLGHILKIVSFYLIYKGIIQTGILRPYDLLFRKLKKNEQDLRKERDALSKAILEVKQLTGLLPICMYCKKIKDEKGYWQKLESYITGHAEVDFSHGLCPECAKKYYSDFHK